MFTPVSWVVFIIGSTVCVLAAFKVFNFVTFCIHNPQKPLQKYKLNASTKGNAEDGVSWALISGSSEGIGFGYAQYLLSLGFGVIILAHEGIPEAEKKLRNAYPDGHIKAITFNCITASVNDIEGLVEVIEKLPVTILINNVGGLPMEYPRFRQFRDFKAHEIDDHWNLNARFMSHITRLMLPLLMKNASPRSLILNITSGARFGMPYLMGYSATKGYVTAFSHTLSRECKVFNYPVDCLLLVPGDVISTGNRLGNLASSPQAAPYAKLVLQKVNIAVERGYLEMSPYWMHALQIETLNWLPESLVRTEGMKLSKLKKEAYAKEHASLQKEQ
jgi:17beta-estradiol 17-dehydrogenase / very-long-chain 3-oxoacyl-CoA reductase